MKGRSDIKATVKKTFRLGSYGCGLVLEFG